MPEKQHRPQDFGPAGGVGAVYRRPIFRCQTRNRGSYSLFLFAILVRARAFARQPSTLNLYGPERNAFNGLCMALVQATKDAGEIRIEATSAGLTSGTATIVTLATPARPALS